eukprot:gene1276-1662_t
MTLMATAVATALTAIGGAALAGQSVPAKAAENTTKYFVELEGAPTTDGGRLDAVRSEKAALRQAIAKAGIKMKERRSFDKLFNGFSVEMSAKDRDRLSRMPGVKAIFPMLVVPAPKPVSAELINKALLQVKARASASELPPANASALAMTG